MRPMLLLTLSQTWSIAMQTCYVTAPPPHTEKMVAWSAQSIDFFGILCCFELWWVPDVAFALALHSESQAKHTCRSVYVIFHQFACRVFWPTASGYLCISAAASYFGSPSSLCLFCLNFFFTFLFFLFSFSLLLLLHSLILLPPPLLLFCVDLAHVAPCEELLWTAWVGVRQAGARNS